MPFMKCFERLTGVFLHLVCFQVVRSLYGNLEEGAELGVVLIGAKA